MVVWDSSVAGSGGTNLFSELSCHFIACLMQNSGRSPHEREWIACLCFVLFFLPSPFLSSKYWFYFTVMELWWENCDQQGFLLLHLPCND